MNHDLSLSTGGTILTSGDPGGCLETSKGVLPTSPSTGVTPLPARIDTTDLSLSLGMSLILPPSGVD